MRAPVGVTGRLRYTQATNLGWAYLGMFWSYVECALIAMTLSAVMLGVSSMLVTLQFVSSFTQPDSAHLSFYSPAAARYKFDVALASLLFLAWIKVRPIIMDARSAMRPCYILPPFFFRRLS